MQAYTGIDLLEFAGRTLADFADGDVAVVTYPNEISSTKTGKNGNSVAVHNEMGRIAELALRVIKGSPDDKFLNKIITFWKSRSSSFTPVDAIFTKVINVDSGIANEVTDLIFGIPTKAVETKENTEGDTEQAISIYNFRFGDSNRSLT